MSIQTYIYRFIVAQFLTLYYSIIMLLVFAINFIKNPFRDPFALKLKLEPPACLSDPKYGTHRYVKVNSLVLHYVESGDSSKPLMLFVHGFPEFWYSWRYQISEFSKDYWCIAVDMRGYGDSEKPNGVSPYKIEFLVEDLKELIKQLGRDKCILVSHDWGGVIACQFRDVYPDMLNGLVVLSSMSRTSWLGEMWSNPKQKKMSWYVFLMRMPWIAEKFFQMNNLEAFDRFFLASGKSTVTKEDVEGYKYWFGKQHTLTPPINYYRANFGYVLPEKKMCDKNVPFLAAMAEKDFALHSNMLEIMKKEYKHIEPVIVKDCGHFMQQEDPQIVNTLIRNFLTKNNI